LQSPPAVVRRLRSGKTLPVFYAENWEAAEVVGLRVTLASGDRKFSDSPASANLRKNIVSDPKLLYKERQLK